MDRPTPIAIVGMSCRLPGGANSPDELWKMLYEGRSGYGPIPPSRWNADSFYHPDPHARESIPFKNGHFLQNDIAEFDARFFRIPPRDANGMDPQQRLLLEATYEALESAGIPLEKVKGTNVACIIAEFARDYDRLSQKDIPNVHQLHVLGCGDAILANRISYLLDFRGPSYTLDTGCSGSLVAIHQACQSIRTGESTLAIAGGCQLILHPDQAMNMSRINMMNPDGKCYVFDERGAGYGRGEGAGVVVLKRLDHALRDGDPIHAVIANSGVNQDGKTNGISLPSAEAQAELAKAVYEAAGLDPAQTLYHEAHGTGTQAGDKVEISSIHDIFCNNSRRASDILVGSIKANIGHLECASGIAALIKSVMVLKKGHVPGNINLEKLKPSVLIQVEGRSIQIPTKAVRLTAEGYTGPKTVSVSGFGYGGTNAVVILTSAESTRPGGLTKGHTNGLSNGLANGHENGLTSQVTNGSTPRGICNTSPTPRLFLLSAAADGSLSDTASRLRAWLLSDGKFDEAQLRDLSYTLAARRSQLSWRSAIIASSFTDLAKQLQTITPIRSKNASPAQITFVFTGQGAQWYAMGRELLQSASVFRDSIHKSAHLLSLMGSGWNLLDELLQPETTSRLNDVEIAQPATTAVQIALVDQLAHFGIRPQRVVGHSSGEIAASYAAGALTHEGALRASYLRGIHSGNAIKLSPCPGSMLAVGLGEQQVAPYVAAMTRGRLVVACINSPQSTTVSGDEEAINELADALARGGVFSRKLKVGTGYHSHHMQLVAESYQASMEIAGLNYASGRGCGVVFFSSVTGCAKRADFGPDYWTENLVSPVQFERALTALVEDMAGAGSQSAHLFVEIGPHSALMSPSRQVVAAVLGDSFKYSYISPLLRGKDAVRTTLEVVGTLFEAGCGLASANVPSLDKSTAKHTVISDLPPYAWDHSSTYWHESRLSRDHRFRRFPYHDLIGLLDTIGDIQYPRWRHHIDPEAMPWLLDHVVDGFILFPGTGYLAMAIEAFRQLTELRKTPGNISSFVMQDIKFIKPIVIPRQSQDDDRQQVEVQLTLTSEGGAGGTRGGHDEVFRVSSWDKAAGVWTEHCTGTISAHIERGANEFEIDVGDVGRAVNRLAQIKESSTEPRDVARFYNNLAASGNVFGPTFRGIHELHVGHLQAFAKVAVPDIASTMPANHQAPHVAHPATLDVLNHVAAALYQQHCGSSPFVAAAIDELSVSAAVPSTAGTELLVACRMTTETGRSASGNTWAFHEADGAVSPVITISGWRLQAIGDAKAVVREGKDLPFQRRMTYKMAWHFDVDHLSDEGFNGQLSEKGLYGIGYPKGFTVHDAMFFRESAALVYIKRAVDRIKSSAQAIDMSSPHLPKLYKWMAQLVKDENKHMIPIIPPYSGPLPGTDTDDFILHQSSKTGAQGAMLERIGTKLDDILTGRVKSLSLMFNDDLLEQLYGEDMMRSNYAQMAQYIKALSFKHPRMRILEIGAGTGGASLPMLQALTDPVDGNLFDRYCYTDISPGFFERARVKFAQWEHRMDFRLLDVSKDPLQQAGFADAEGTFDLIVAANVLHATPLLDVTVANCRRLLRPGGRMILMEVTRLTLTLNTIFGTLPGWWMSEDGRANTPTISGQEWDALLKRNGFAGVEIAAPDHQGNTAQMTAMVCRAVAQSQPHSNGAEPHVMTVLLGRDDGLGMALARSVCRALNNSGVQANVQSIESATTTKENGSYILLDVAEHRLLKNPSKVQFSGIQGLLTSGKNVLWATLQTTTSADAMALKGMVNGMARVARHENSFLKLVTVDVRDTLTPAAIASLSSNITGIITSSFWPTGTGESSNELEYSVEAGHVLIPRIRADDKFNTWVASTRADNKTTAPARFHSGDRPLKLEPEVPGLLNTLRFVDDPLTSAALAPHQIQLRPSAYGVNFKDVFVALGQGPPGAIMAGEVAGVVTAVGTEMSGLYKVGDRVAGMGAEPYSSCPRLHGLNAHKLPDGVSFSEGASAVAVYATAWHCLVNVAKLCRGETILIHSGSGGVGQAAIQIAQYLGAEVYTTVGSAAKLQLVMDTYGIPSSHIFSSGSTTFKQGVLNLSNGKGADVVLNSLAGEHLKASLTCTAEFGRFVEIGKSDIYKKSHLSMAHFDRGISMVAVDFVLITRSRPQIVHDAMKAVYGLFESGTLKPVAPIITFPIAKVEEAFRLIAGRRHTGKLVVLTEEDSNVDALLAPPKPLSLHGEGTYVVVGGLGDLGRRVCGLLARAGAGHIVTLSRSLLPDAQMDDFRSTIEAGDSELHMLRCDITDAGRVQDVASWCRERLPAVRGVIHSALVLRDRPLELMTIDEYMTAVKPKVHGTLNLHDAFASPDLDAFIMLSSSTGILGMKGQGNYAAGNTFQDAFADAQNARPGNHTRYVSLDIGAVAGSGHIARLPLQGIEMQKQSVLFMSFDEVTMLLEYALGPSATPNNFSHCMVGFDREAMVTMQDTTTLNNPMFALLPEKKATEMAGSPGSAGGKQADIDPGKLVETATTLKMAEEIITKATADKFSVFLDTVVSVDVPISQLAIDSLVSIELKNWMSKTFQAPVQASEIAGALSIGTLGKLLTERSKLIPDHMKASPNEPKENGYTAVETVDEGSSKETVENPPSAPRTSHGLECCKHLQTLPKSPLPDLDDVLDYLLANSGHLYTPQEFQLLNEAADELRAAEGPGSVAYHSLVERYNDTNSNSDSWLYDLVTDTVYLKRRFPIAPFSSFVGSNYDGEVKHTQVERAVALTLAVLDFRKQVVAGEVEPYWFAGRPTCTSQLRWLFGSVREPSKSVDKMRMYPDSDHIVVLRRGRAFRVPLHQGGDGAAPERLEATFRAIIHTVQDEGLWTGLLATDERDSWAEIRAKALQLNPANFEYIAAIERAIFVLCLDDGAPESDADQIRQAWFGDGANRWADKGMQIVVAANGKSSVILEHGAIDGLTSWRFSEHIQQAILSNAHAQANGSRLPFPDVTLHELTFHTTPDLNAHMLALRAAYLKATAPAEYRNHVLTAFGTDALLAAGMPVKAVLDATVQLAIRLHYGAHVPCWEGVSMAHYHKGRNDLLQTTTPAAVGFCAAALDGTTPPAALKAHLLVLSKDMGANMQRCRAGRTHVRFLELLRDAWPADAPPAKMFEANMWWPAPFVVLQHVPEGVSGANMLHGVQKEGCFFISVSPRASVVNVAIDGTTGNTAPFAARLTEAAAIIHAMVRA